MFPTHRPRRLRRTSPLRDLVRETRLHPDELVLPLFVDENLDDKVEIGSMRGVYRHTMDSLRAEAEAAAEAGVKALLLFGIPAHKDLEASGAHADDGVVQRALRALKADGLPLVLIADTCLCEYTSHGHCGILHPETTVDNDPTLALLAATAVSQARAGADVVAPSDMMDGRVDAIRTALDADGLVDVPILSYAAKYASAFYGPFRDAADSAPAFGDRSQYQMDPPNAREAIKEVLADIDEGADMVMVKPALPYLDIIRQVKDITDVPVAAYNVSGEYTMIELMAEHGYMDRRRGVLEVLTSIKRAGADILITYHALEVAGWLRAE